MSVLHLQIDIDSEVHPELHAMLSSMSDSSPRAERLRQLASNGLIWEHLRVRAQPNVAIDTPVTNDIDKFRTDRPAEIAETRLQSSNQPAVAEISVRAGEMAVQELPVLLDAVDADELPLSRSAVARPGATGPTSKRRAVPAAAAPRKKAPLSETAAGAAVLGSSSPRSVARSEDGEVVRLPQGPARPRPRLLRMKEKGLFSNG